jgi:hypothetical protein
LQDGSRRLHQSRTRRQDGAGFAAAAEYRQAFRDQTLAKLTPDEQQTFNA